MSVHLFGIRHHGPGSARSLGVLLADLAPDIILIEGPPDADDLIPLVGADDALGMVPPVALLIYSPDETRRAVYYPFAEYSPEFIAMRYGVKQGINVRFMDLPQTVQFGIALQQEAAAQAEAQHQQAEAAAQPPADLPPDQHESWLEQFKAQQAQQQAPVAAPELTLAEQVQRDPLGWLGRSAGYSDGERWWEHVIEQRREDLAGVFQAVLEAMTALRETAGEVTDINEARREATMRTKIRAAQAEGFQRIAVVCGAWHTPALDETTFLWHSAEQDAATLEGLPTAEVKATWIPWTHGRLSRESGYGAGIESPGWYHHLWTHEQDIVIHWLTRVAALLREQDLDASTAQIIDATRLVDTLSAIRGLSLPGLEEMTEAIQATMVFGAETPMRLIHQQLIVGERMGRVPPDTPLVPLQRDLILQVQQLGSPKSTGKKGGNFFGLDPEETPLTLDLNDPKDVARSTLLYRLQVLNIEWGKPQHEGIVRRGEKFESWRLNWQPEYEIRLIEQSVWGNTIEEAANASVIDQANKAEDLPKLTELVNKVLNADLPDATQALIRQLQAKAAIASDMHHLMDALPPLVNVLRYNNRRHFDITALEHVVEGIATRINIGLLNACSALDDAAAEEMFKRIEAVHEAVHLLEESHYREGWLMALRRVTGGLMVHGLVRGRGARLLLNSRALTHDAVANLMRLAIATAAAPTDAAAWVEGFLRGSGTILIRDEEIFRVVDQWANGLAEREFVTLLPLLRRTFTTFQPPERRQIGERVKHTRLGQITPTAPVPAAAGAPQPTLTDPQSMWVALEETLFLLGLSLDDSDDEGESS